MANDLTARLRAVRGWWRAPGSLAAEAATHIDHLEAKLAAAEAERDRMRAALQKCRDAFWSFTLWEAGWGPERSQRVCENSSRKIQMIDAALKSEEPANG